MSKPADNPPSSRESTPNDQLQTPDHSVASTSPEQGERTPEIVKLSKSKGASALDKYYSEDDQGMFFLNLQQAVAATDHAQWYSPRPDDTIPVNEDQDRQVVRRLVDAFLDTSNAMDTEGNAYRKRFTPGTNVFYDTWTIERCAWEVLVRSIVSFVMLYIMLIGIGRRQNYTPRRLQGAYLRRRNAQVHRPD